MRITKEYDERKQEIIDKSGVLFGRKGYEKTTVADIVRAVDIAKGTFYHYFKTKEEVLDALVNQKIDRIVHSAQLIADNNELKVKEKLFMIILGSDEETAVEAERMEDKDLKEALHSVVNEKLHLRSVIVTITKLAPVLTQVIEQGVEEGIFNTEYPLETMELLLVSSSFLFDEGIFQWEPDEVMKKIRAFVHVMEVSLGAERGSLSYLMEVIQYGDSE
jgi:AcrR family transcriptional regulator